MPWMIPNILKNLSGSPATRKYPLVPLKHFTGSRGRLRIDLERCDFCGVCARVCPAKAVVRRGSKKDPDVTLLYDPFACIYCALCVEKCPLHAISLDKSHPPPATIMTRETYLRTGRPTSYSEDESAYEVV